MIRLTAFFIFAFLALSFPVRVSAMDGTGDVSPLINASNTLDAFDFSPVSQTAGVDFRGLVAKAINGELDLSFSGLMGAILGTLFREVRQNIALLRNLALIAILSAVLSNLAESFKNKSVGELGFYACYMALVTLLFASFQVTLGILTDMSSTVSNIMGASLPLLSGVMAASGNVAGAAGFTPLFAAGIEAVAIFVSKVMAPLLTTASAITIVNYLTENQVLSRLADLLKKAADWALKGAALLFLGLVSLQKLSAPILNNAAVKTARSAAGAAPVVGGILGGAMDTVLVWGAAAKSGVLVALVIALVTVCSLPLLKLLALLAIYKIIAALIAPACDPRIVKCVDAIASFTALALGAATAIAAMFIAAAVIMLSF